jgi:serpin B
MKNYSSLIKRSLNATTESIAFIKSVQAAKKINDWIANATHNLITSLLPSSAFNARTKLLVVNCIYFKSNWQTPFRKSSTFAGSFNAFNDKKVPVNYMTRTRFYDYNENSNELNGASVVSLNYKNSNASMLFVLPPKDTDFESWMSGINKVDWNVVVDSLNNTYLNVTIPKFNITYLRDMTEAVKKVRVLLYKKILSYYFSSTDENGSNF